MRTTLMFILINICFITGLSTQNSIPAKENTKLHIIKSFYSKDSPDAVSFYRIVQDSGSIYYTAGKLNFDTEGNVIQKIIKNKKINKNKLEKYISKASKGRSVEIIKDSPKVIFIQLKTKDNPDLFQKRKIISKKIEDKLTANNLGTSYGIDKGDNVINLEVEVNDRDRSLAIIIEVLKEENALQHCIIGKRIYIEADDYLFEIIYPIDFEGQFYPF